MALIRVHQREIVEVNFRFLNGQFLPHPALVVSTDDLQDTEDGMFYAVLISSKNHHPEYTVEINPDDLIGPPMPKQSYFVTHILAFFSTRDVVSRHNAFLKKDKFNEIIDTVIDNIFGPAV